MHSLPLVTLLASTAAAAAAKSTLYASHYNGTVYTLSLSDNGPDNNPDNALTIASAADTCGNMPSWLTQDSASGNLYCSDESGNATVPGSLTALSTRDAKLEETVKVEDIGAGVHSTLYGGENGNEYLAVAHYDASAISTFSLPLSPFQAIHQTFHYNLTGRPAPKPQQDASHPHQVLPDPSGDHLISPDLGMDLIHVYSINKETGHLTECKGVEFPAGSGPRHGVFTSKGNATKLYMVSELSGELSVFTVNYPTPGGCPTFQKLQSIIPYPGGQLPAGASPAGIQVRDNNIYISLRNDQSYPQIKSDAIATLLINTDGTVTFHNLTPSYGKVPRTLVANESGDLVAIGNQASASVAVVRRLGNGDLGEAVGRVLVGEEGRVGQKEGLSSVIWGSSRDRVKDLKWVD